MTDFNEQIKLRYEELTKQRISIKNELRLLKKLLENAGAMNKKARKPWTPKTLKEKKTAT